MKLPKKAMLVLSAVVILSALGGGPAMASRGNGGGGGGAPEPQLVDICHRDEQGAYTLISVEADQVRAHLDHDDVTPDDAGNCPSDPVVEVAGTTEPVAEPVAEPVVEPVVEAVAEPVADQPVAQPVVEAQVTLPRTGVDTAQQSLIGLVLVGAGLLLLALRRRPSAADPA